MALVEKDKRILCVEDDPDTCRLVSAFLPEFEIVSVATVKDATHRHAEEKFSLIITDYHLADGSGLHLCEQIRSSDYLTPIVVISGDHELTVADVRIAGAQRLITKGSVTFLDELRSATELLHVK
jgi:DNA-binding response OmpR family regulator